MPPKRTQAVTESKQDDSPIMEPHTINKVQERLRSARQSCLQSAYQIEVTLNWLDKQGANKV